MKIQELITKQTLLNGCVKAYKNLPRIPGDTKTLKLQLKYAELIMKLTSSKTEEN